MLKNIVKKLMTAIDRLTVRSSGFRTIEGSESGCVYIDLQTYKGPDKELKDGSIILSGDRVGEVHMNNQVMNAMGEMSLASAVRTFGHELDLLAGNLDGDYSQLKAIYGRSQIYAILRRIGFEIHEIESKRMRLFLSYWDSIYKWAFSAGRNNKFKRREPKEVWMSREAIQKRLDAKAAEAEVMPLAAAGSGGK